MRAMGRLRRDPWERGKRQGGRITAPRRADFFHTGRALKCHSSAESPSKVVCLADTFKIPYQLLNSRLTVTWPHAQSQQRRLARVMWFLGLCRLSGLEKERVGKGSIERGKVLRLSGSQRDLIRGPSILYLTLFLLRQDEKRKEI